MDPPGSSGDVLAKPTRARIFAALVNFEPRDPDRAGCLVGVSRSQVD